MKSRLPFGEMSYFLKIVSETRVEATMN